MKSRCASVLLSFSALALVACGGGSKGAQEPEPTEAQSVCKVDETIKATAKPKPKESGCIDKAAWQKMSDDCKAKDAVACYRIGVCLKLQSLGNDRLSAEDKKKHFDATLMAMRIACDDGIAAACVFRAGVISEELKANPGRTDKNTLEKQKCTDLVRACNLGDESGGCAGCRFAECK
jgi:hypothetical protein